MVTRPPPAATSPGTSVPANPNEAIPKAATDGGRRQGPKRAATTSVLARLKRPATAGHPQADKEHDMAEEHKINHTRTIW